MLPFNFDESMTLEKLRENRDVLGNRIKEINEELSYANKLKTIVEPTEVITKPIQEVFADFCKLRHKEDKGKNFNLLQEIYANTELFDVSMTTDNQEVIGSIYQDNFLFGKSEFLKGCALPFESIFAYVGSSNYIFIREFSPSVITGTLFVPLGKYDTKVVNDLNCPFEVFINSGEINLVENRTQFFELLNHHKEYPQYLDTLKGMCKDIFGTIINALDTINRLNKHKVYSEINTNSKTEYYRRKGKSTIKVSNRPLYYVLNPKDTVKERNLLSRKSETCHIEYSHSFKVRGHWRRINPTSYGKNRDGEYIVVGSTWVRECTKGEGELVKKLRVIKDK